VLELRDPFSSTSHLLTALWAVFATLVMWRLTVKRPERVAPIIVYGLSMVLLYTASGTFHGVPYLPSSPEGRFFQKLDQSAVYLLIAGSVTPAIAILLEGAWRKWFLRMMWALAFAGVACMWLLPKAPHAAIVGFYLGLGWLCVLPTVQFYRAVGWRAMNWVWIGAGFYTLGAIFDLAHWPVIIPGQLQWHEMLHMCDVCASLALFIFVIRYVIPYQKAPATDRVLAKAAA
jgi:hemolysin III